MKISELMKTNVEVCRLDELVESVAERMRARNIGFLPVCDESGVIVGTVTDRDLTTRVLGERRRPESTTAGEEMTRDVVSCAASDDLMIAEELMSKYKVSRVVCLDDTRRPIGVVSLSDVAGAESRGKASAVLRSVSQRESHS